MSIAGSTHALALSVNVAEAQRMLDHDGLNNPPVHLCLGRWGWDWLHVASYHGHVKVVRTLLDSGTDINCRTNRGHTPLRLAIFSKEHDMVRLLLQSGADMTHVDEDGKTLLMFACKADVVEIVRLLLDRNDDTSWISKRDVNNNTALHYARSPEVARLLLEKGADINFQNKYSRTAFQEAKRKNHESVAKYLKRLHEFDANKQSYTLLLAKAERKGSNTTTESVPLALWPATIHHVINQVGSFGPSIAFLGLRNAHSHLAESISSELEDNADTEEGRKPKFIVR